jgi:aminopeptidase
MCGVHLSMGAKHHVYKKPGIKKKHVRHHVDVFVVADALSFDGEVVYSGGSWTVGQG